MLLKKRFLDRVSECGQKYITTSHFKSTTQSRTVPIHHPKAEHRNGTLRRLRANSRSYLFKSLPGTFPYRFFEHVLVADLPGLIADSHKNRGLGIQFLKHAERCKGLLFILDMSLEHPWEQLATLQYELQQFSDELAMRPQLVIANKMDLPESAENLELLRGETDLPVYAISAKTGVNLLNILQAIRKLSDENAEDKEESCEKSET